MRMQIKNVKGLSLQYVRPRLLLSENLGSKTQKIQMLAKAMAATFRKGKWRIFYI